MDLGIAGRKAIVCASSRGLGRACATRLAEAGCEVVVNGLDAKRLDATAAPISKTNRGALPCRDSLRLDRDKIIAGVVGNMIVPVELLQRAIDPMIKKKWGRIVNITSGSVKMPPVGLDLSSAP